MLASRLPPQGGEREEKTERLLWKRHPFSAKWSGGNEAKKDTNNMSEDKSICESSVFANRAKGLWPSMSISSSTK